MAEGVGGRRWRSALLAVSVVAAASVVAAPADPARAPVGSKTEAVTPSPAETETPGTAEALRGHLTPVQLPESASLATVPAARRPMPAAGRATQLVTRAAVWDVPRAALAAYQRSAAVMGATDPRCHLPWQLLAAIGRVESDHGRFGDSTLDAEGRAVPPIVGRRLDGTSGTAAIPDSDAGRLDGDRRWDRAVGPMQFIPTTWSAVAVDSDGDGRRDPQDIDDAALAAGVYLCAGSGNLSRRDDLRRAVLRYNNSAEYVALVLALLEAYQQPPASVVIPASVLPGPGTLPPPLPPTATRVRGGAPTGGDRPGGAGSKGAGSKGDQEIRTLPAPTPEPTPEPLSEGAPDPEPEVEEPPAEEEPVEEEPVEEEPVEEQPAEEEPAEEAPAEQEPPAGEQPAEEEPATEEEQPVDEEPPVEEQPAEEEPPAEEQPAEEQPLPECPGATAAEPEPSPEPEPTDPPQTTETPPPASEPPTTTPEVVEEPEPEPTPEPDPTHLPEDPSGEPDEEADQECDTPEPTDDP